MDLLRFVVTVHRHGKIINDSTKPRGCKTFPMLNSAEREIGLVDIYIRCHEIKLFTLGRATREICHGNKYQNANSFWHFNIY